MSNEEPITLSMAWGIEPSSIAAVGAINVTLNCDTNLFIDPLLLSDASDAEFRKCSTAAYEARFGLLIELLSSSKAEGDAAWRAAGRHLAFHEVALTHLGYSSGTGGSGMGAGLSGNVLATAKEVIDLGVNSPDLFIALALLEDGIGADRISDMTTNIVLQCLADFTKIAANRLGIGTESFKIANKTFELPPNPIKSGEPLLLVPRDIVRDLPVASDWSSVGAAAQETQDLRDRVNTHIGEIWRAKTRKDKHAIRDNALRSKKSFETLLEILRNAADDSYDLNNDHRGELYPAEIRQHIATREPLDLFDFSGRVLSLDEVDSVVVAIINRFKDLVENKGLWKEFWDEKQQTARLEKAMQRLFYAVAAAYCDANNLDISPESDAGCGPVDFKVSLGADAKVLVELKRSSNPKVVDAYTTQLDAYRNAEGTLRAHYVVIDIGGLSAPKMTGLTGARNALLAAGLSPSTVVIIDGNPQASASKR